MFNHYHLVIETPEANLSRGMRQLNGVYTQKFNWRHHRVGHVFQGRYKSILVERESYLLELTRYVVLNPVRAELVDDPKDWPWSSYKATAGLEEAPEFLTTDWILGQFTEERQKAQGLYRIFVSEGKNETPWKNLKGGIFLGSEEFIEGLGSYLEDKIYDLEIPRPQRLAMRASLGQLFSGLKKGEKKERDRRIYEAIQDYGYTLKEVAAYLGLHYSTVSKAYSRAKEIDKFKT